METPNNRQPYVEETHEGHDHDMDVDTLRVIEVDSLADHIDDGDVDGANVTSAVDDGTLSDDTLPAEVPDSIAELDSELKESNSPFANTLEIEFDDSDEDFTENPSPVKNRGRKSYKSAPTTTNNKRSKPKQQISTKPGPKSSKRTLPKRLTASDRKHSTLISLGPYRHVNVCLEITGVEGMFSRVNGEVIFTVPQPESGVTKNQWKLSDILRELESASAAPDPVDDPDDPYGPLLNDFDDLPSSPEPDTRPKSSRKSRAQAYECIDCSLTFKRRSDLTVHQRNGLCPALVGPFHCDECGLTLNTVTEMKKHRKSHNRALCHLCGKTFPVGHCMKQHMITHAGYKPFDCQICGAQFRSKTARSLHESTHKEERPHICQMCGTSFKRIGLLKRHIKFVHNQEAKDVRCKTCGRGFRSKSDLNAHLPSHTGEKRFCCDQCGKRFAYKVCLSDHMKTVHSDIRAYKCSECDKAFKTSSMLASHRRSHTKQANSSYSQPAKPAKVSNSTNNEVPMMNAADYNNTMSQQRPVTQNNGGDFTQYSQRYIPQVGDYSMPQNVFSPLRYLDLTGPAAGGGQGQKPHVGQIYRDTM